MSDDSRSVGSQSKRLEATLRSREMKGKGYEDRRFAFGAGGRHGVLPGTSAMAEAERVSLAFDFPNDLIFFE